VDGFIHRFILAIGEDPEKFKAFVSAAEARKNEARAFSPALRDLNHESELSSPEAARDDSLIAKQANGQA
jgi:hypothetical protein